MKKAMLISKICLRSKCVPMKISLKKIRTETDTNVEKYRLSTVVEIQIALAF